MQLYVLLVLAYIYSQLRVEYAIYTHIGNYSTTTYNFKAIKNFQVRQNTVF